MPILTVEKFQELTQDPSYEKVELISTLIINFQDWLCNYLNNFFHTSKYVYSTGISFSSDTISDSNEGFVTGGFTNGNDIHVTNFT